MCEHNLLSIYYVTYCILVFYLLYCVGVKTGELLSCVNDIAAGTQHTVASHIVKRTHRAILFCKERGLLPQRNPTLVCVVSI